MEPSTRIELVAFSLPRKCSTTELRRQNAWERYYMERARPYCRLITQWQQKVGSPSNALGLLVPRRLDSQEALPRYLPRRNQIASADLRTIHAKEFDLTNIVSNRRPTAMQMRTKPFEFDRAISKSSRLYLHAMEHTIRIFNHHVVASTVTVRHQDSVAGTH